MVRRSSIERGGRGSSSSVPDSSVAQLRPGGSGSSGITTAGGCFFPLVALVVLRDARCRSRNDSAAISCCTSFKNFRCCSSIARSSALRGVGRESYRGSSSSSSLTSSNSGQESSRHSSQQGGFAVFGLYTRGPRCFGVTAGSPPAGAASRRREDAPAGSEPCSSCS